MGKGTGDEIVAEFQEVIEQFKRLCDSANQDCSSCRLGNMSCSIKDIVDNSVEFEKRVMSWAAEHPEPIYPTWEEYFVSKGLLKPYWNENGTAPYDMYKYAELALSNTISTDIAQKLGIKPKE